MCVNHLPAAGPHHAAMKRHTEHMHSRRVAGLVGPVVMAMTASEFPPVQPHLYAEQTPPVVYLSGVLLFTAGLAILRSHSRWTADWTLLITLTGWGGILLGLVRMFAASAYHQAAGSAEGPVFMIIEIILFAAGAVMTAMAYRPLR